MLTEGDELRDALSIAALAWPELANDKPALLKKLIGTGAAQLKKRETSQRLSRLKAIGVAAGSLDSIWPENWRAESLSEWPE